MSIPFKVCVTRHYIDRSGAESCFGMFVSRVYAIDGTDFLVWDPGELGTCAGFRWVDFTETMTSLTLYNEDGERLVVPCVNLIDEEDEA